MRYETYETTQPWVIYTYLYHDNHWRVRLLGRTAIRIQCCICGESFLAKLRIPRWGPVKDNDMHPLRVSFLAMHKHPLQQTAPETWVLPLRNPDALGGGDMLDIFRDVAEKARRSFRGER